jgi:hypothetical protein
MWKLQVIYKLTELSEDWAASSYKIDEKRLFLIRLHDTINRSLRAEEVIGTEK